MIFRPCIDIHDGKVKQIVGASLAEESVRENYTSDKDAAWFASLYREKNLPGGHVILLNAKEDPMYPETLAQAKKALAAWPGALMAGGGIDPKNAEDFLDAGASHVIVTSYVFRDGKIDRTRLEEMVQTVGRDRLVLDLSCRAVAMTKGSSGKQDAQNVLTDAPASEHLKQNGYYVATDRWQKLSDVEVTPELFSELSAFCAEFLVHAVDVEGKSEGVEEDLLRILASATTTEGSKITYAGGIHSMEDIETIRELGEGRIDYTVGSALDLFGGTLSFEALA